MNFIRKKSGTLKIISQKVGHEIVGTYHSHPLYIASPCRTDIANAVDDSIMLIIDATDKKTALWHIKNGKKRKVAFTLLK